MFALLRDMFEQGRGHGIMLQVQCVWQYPFLHKKIKRYWEDDAHHIFNLPTRWEFAAEAQTSLLHAVRSHCLLLIHRRDATVLARAATDKYLWWIVAKKIIIRFYWFFICFYFYYTADELSTLFFHIFYSFFLFSFIFMLTFTHSFSHYQYFHAYILCTLLLKNSHQVSVFIFLYLWFYVKYFNFSWQRKLYTFVV